MPADEMALTHTVLGLLRQSGHLDHGAWTVEGRDGLLRCSCGAVVAKVVYP